jgi:hypothetical protein
MRAGRITRSRRPRVSDWILSVSIGCSCALAYLANGFPPHADELGPRVLLFTILAGLFTVSSRLFLHRFLTQHLLTFSRAARLAWILSSLGMGAFLVVVIPLPLPSSAPNWHILELVATGAKGAAAQGSQVALIGLFLGNGSRLPNSEFSMQGEWQSDAGILVSSGHQPASLGWDGFLDDDVVLRLSSDAQSGQAEILWDSEARVVDLYSPQAVSRAFRLPAAGGVDANARLISSRLVVFGADMVSLALGVLAASVWLVTRTSRVRASRVGRWTWLGYALPSLAVWTICLLVFYPGLMTADSIDQWGQFVTWHLDDAHPVFHTLTNWFLTRLWLSPAAVALAQLIAQSLLVGWGLSRLQQWGVRRWHLWMIALSSAFWPVCALTVITLWKDVPYGIAVLALTLCVMEIVCTRGEWLRWRWAWVILGVVAAFVALFRHNGISAALCMLVILILAYRELWRNLVLALLLMVILCVGIQGPLYDALGATRQNWVPLLPLIHQVAAEVASRPALSDQEEQYLSQIRPLGDNWRYSCYSIDPTIWDGHFTMGVIDADPRRFVNQWWSLALRQPSVAIAHIVCSSALVWQITQGQSSFLNATALWIDHGRVATLPDNSYGIHAQSLLPQVEPLLATSLISSFGAGLGWLIWRPALYLYLALASVGVAAIRQKSCKYLLIALPVVIQSATLLFATISQDVRYQYPVYLVVLVLIPLVSIRDVSCAKTMDDYGTMPQDMSNDGIDRSRIAGTETLRSSRRLDPRPAE